MHKFRPLFSILLFALGLISVPLFAATSSQLELTEEEQRWLLQHPVISVQNEADFPPFNFNNGSPAGFSVDYIKLLGQKLGVDIRFVEKVTWPQTLTLFEEGKLDVVANIAFSTERAQQMKFTEPYINTYTAIYVASEGVTYRSLSSLTGKVVSLPKGYLLEELMRQFYPNIEVLATKDTMSAIRAVKDGRAVATLNESAYFAYLLKENKISGLRLSAMINDPNFSNALHFAVKSDDKILHSLLNKAIDAVSDEEYRAIYERWISSRPMDNWHLKYLTHEERQWLAQHRVWRVGVDPKLHPLDFFDENGQHAGLASEYINFVAQALDIELAYQPELSWSETIDKIKQYEIDVLALAGKTEQREEFLNFSDSYMRYPMVIVTHVDNTDIKKHSDLTNKRIALVDNYPVTEIALNSGMQFQYEPSKSIKSALYKVARKEADAMVIDIASASYQMTRLDLSELQIVAHSEFPAPDFAIAIRKDWKPLVSIVNKVLATIPPEQKLMFSNRWFSISPQFAKDENNHQVSYETTGWKTTYVIVVTLLLLITLFALALYVFRSRDNDNFNTFTRSRIIKIAIGFNSLLILFVSLMAWYALTEIKKGLLDQTQESLITILNTTDRSFTIWMQNQKRSVKSVASNPSIANLTKEQLQHSNRTDDLATTGSLKALRLRLKELNKINDFRGFFIITESGKTIGAMRDEFLGKENIIYQQEPELFFRASNGETVWVPPVKYELPDSPNGNLVENADHTTMFVMAPLYDDQGKFLAVLALQLDPYSEYSEILNLGRIGKTGETFVFDRTARLLSPSRFEDELIQLDRISESQQSILNVHLSIPGNNKPSAGSVLNEEDLTLLAQNSINQTFGYDMRGYINYRGLKTVGAWLWNHEFNVGLATELELNEALEPYLNARYFFLLILLITLLIAATLSTLIVVLGARVTQKMKKTNEMLEKKVEKRTADLREKQIRLQSLFDSSSEAIVIFDGFKVIDANPAALNLFQTTSKQDLIDFGIDNMVINKTNKSMIALLKDVFERTQSERVVRLDLWLRKTSGKVFEAEVALSLVPMFSQNLTQAIIRDISPQREYEKKLKRAFEQAEMANVAKSRFLANMSHEIRTPMNGVISLANLLNSSNLTDEQRKYVTTIEHCGKSLLTIINSILDFSKIEAGKLELSEQEFDLLELINNLKDIFSLEASSKSIVFNVDTQKLHTPQLFGDDIRLNQILINLLGNAVKFTSQGEVTLKVTQGKMINGQIPCTFEVIDTGIGISQSALAKLFDSFSQVDSSTTREFGGTGLGLAICKELVHLMGGTIEVRSQIDKGSRFIVRINFAKASFSQLSEQDKATTNEQPLKTVMESSDTLQGVNILVVEDNAVNQLIISKFLDKHSATYTVLDNGQKAIQAVSENNFDLILMDIQMPVLDGIEATKIIREKYSKEQLPIIALTANVMQSDIEHYLKSGMNDHVGKPIDFELLLSKINTLSHSKKSQ